MMADQNAREMNERVSNLNEIIKQIQQRSVLPVRLLDVASMMKHSLSDDASSDGTAKRCLPKAYKPSGVRHAGDGPVHLCPSPTPPFFTARPLSDRLEGRIDSRESSRSSRSRQLEAIPMEGDEVKLSTPQSSVVSSVLVEDNKKMDIPG